MYLICIPNNSVINIRSDVELWGGKGGGIAEAFF